MAIGELVCSCSGSFSRLAGSACCSNCCFCSTCSCCGCSCSSTSSTTSSSSSCSYCSLLSSASARPSVVLVVLDVGRSSNFCLALLLNWKGRLLTTLTGSLTSRLMKTGRRGFGGLRPKLGRSEAGALVVLLVVVDVVLDVARLLPKRL